MWIVDHAELPRRAGVPRPNPDALDPTTGHQTPVGHRRRPTSDLQPIASPMLVDESPHVTTPVDGQTLVVGADDDPVGRIPGEPPQAATHDGGDRLAGLRRLPDGQPVVASGGDTGAPAARDVQMRP